MLNWIAIWVTQALVGQGGQLQNSDRQVGSGLQRHRPGRPPAGLLGRPGPPGAAHRVLHRPRRARRLLAAPQPDDPRLRGARDGLQPGGGAVRRCEREAELRAAMAISGTFAGLAGALDILGWQFRLGVLDIQVSQIGFIGIAVALLGRNSAIGVPARRAPLRRAPPGHLDAEPGDPGRDQAGARRQPDADHPGARAALRRRRPVLPLDLEVPEEDHGASRPPRRHQQPQERPQVVSALSPAVQRSDPLRGDRAKDVGWARSASLRSGSGSALPPVTLRSPVVAVRPRSRWSARRRRVGGRARRDRKLGWGGVRPRPASARSSPTARPGRAWRTSTARFTTHVRRRRRRLGRVDLQHVHLRDAARVRGDRRHVLRAQRGREHRARGDDALRLLLRHPRRRQAQLVGARPRHRGDLGRRAGADPRVLLGAHALRPDRRRDGDQLPRPRDHRLLLHPDLRPERHARHGHPVHPGRQPELPEPHPAEGSGPAQLLVPGVRPPEPDDLGPVRP